MWNAKDEDVTYPSLIMDDFLYLGEEECALEKVPTLCFILPYFHYQI
jgi:hypothetical protein